MSAIIFGIQSFSLTTQEKNWLRHSNSAGIILFSRNYQNREQLSALCAEIRHLAPEKILTVDHEGGRVQRFREGFTLLPAQRQIGLFYEQQPQEALQLAEDIGLMMGTELADFDFSLTPVLDLYDARSRVIADRSFSPNAAAVSALSIALRRGLRRAGMAAVGKHYPGHGRIEADSHHQICHDFRPLAERQEDKKPFLDNILDGIEGIMPAHIIYPESEALPAGFSPPMLRQLRQEGFQGAILSDDLDMAGAMTGQHYGVRVQQALAAGVDCCLICNRFDAIEEALDYDYSIQKETMQRLQALKRRHAPDMELYQEAKERFNLWQDKYYGQ